METQAFIDRMMDVDEILKTVQREVSEYVDIALDSDDVAVKDEMLSMIKELM